MQTTYFYGFNFKGGGEWIDEFQEKKISHSHNNNKDKGYEKMTNEDNLNVWHVLK